MDDQERSKWLDDGLHMKEFGYDRLGQLVADALVKAVKQQ
jgi:lysophospholipase L1-like esterase